MCVRAQSCPALSLGLFRQEYWNGLPFPTPGDLPNPGIELAFPESLILAGGFFVTEPPEKPHLFLWAGSNSWKGIEYKQISNWSSKQSGKVLPSSSLHPSSLLKT